MTRKKKLALVAAVLVALVAGTLTVLWHPTPRLTREHLELVREGMSRQEVEAVLGGPAGDYTTGPIREGPGPFATAWYGHGSIHETWVTDTGVADVWFHCTGDVIDKDFWPAERIPQGAIENLLWRARRAWQRPFAAT